jgi:hypothetical protein
MPEGQITPQDIAEGTELDFKEEQEARANRISR